MMLQIRKKRIVLTIAIAIMSSLKLSYSQTILYEPAKTFVGVSGGANLSMVMFKPNVEQEPLLRYVGGLAFRYVTENHFGLQIELNYSQRGWEEKSGKYTRGVDYVELPFLSHIYFGKTHRFFLNVGPRFSVKTAEIVLRNDTISTAAEQHLSPLKYSFDYGVVAGLGYNFYHKKAGIFQIEFRGYYGLADTFSNDAKDIFKTSNMLNASVTLGWFFQVSGRNRD